MKIVNTSIEDIKKDIKFLRQVNNGMDYHPDPEKLLLDILEKLLKQVEILEIKGRDD